jgi:hypothetical protein
MPFTCKGYACNGRIASNSKMVRPLIQKILSYECTTHSGVRAGGKPSIPHVLIAAVMVINVSSENVNFEVNRFNRKYLVLGHSSPLPLQRVSVSAGSVSWIQSPRLDHPY